MRIILNGLLIALLFSTPLSLIGATEQPVTSMESLETVTLDVQKMDCPMCKITIRKALERVDGVKEAKVDYDAKTARVTFDTRVTHVDVLTQATTDAGYPSTLKQE